MYAALASLTAMARTSYLMPAGLSSLSSEAAANGAQNPRHVSLRPTVRGLMSSTAERCASHTCQKGKAPGQQAGEVR